MKAWLIYWLIGCVIVGLPLGSLLRECPDADVKTADIMVVIATWPAIIIAASFGGEIKRTKNKCSVAAPS